MFCLGFRKGKSDQWSYYFHLWAMNAKDAKVTYERTTVRHDLSLTKRGDFVGSVNILNPMQTDPLLLFTV